MKTNSVFILIWIAALTFVSGLLNGTGFLAYASALSHHTGNLTRAAVAIEYSFRLAYIDLARFVFYGCLYFGFAFS